MYVMQTKQIKISPVELEHISKIDSSIEHWSLTHARKQLEADAALAHVRSMYTAKGQFFSNKSTEVGVKAETVQSSELIKTDDGAVLVVTYDAQDVSPEEVQVAPAS
jgi:hypothetical protein